MRWFAGPYPWRHTYASIGISEGIRPAFLAKQLGHSPETFYRAYARLLESEADQAELEKMEQTWSSGKDEADQPPRIH